MANHLILSFAKLSQKVVNNCPSMIGMDQTQGI